jgi:hypothetical protein
MDTGAAPSGLRRRRTGGVVAVVLLAAVALVAVVVGVRGRTRCSRWPEGTRSGGMVLTYGGYGSAEACRHDGAWEWHLSPRPASKASETHAALASTTGVQADLRLRVRMRTVRRLREPAPRSWEVAWVIWHYTDDHHFYYLTLKPNGWELGKEDPAYPGAQRYLATGSSPRYDVGEWHTAQVTQTGDTITARVDGRQITRLRDTEHPYLRGHVGLYTEDAAVRFTGLRIG